LTNGFAIPRYPLTLGSALSGARERPPDAAHSSIVPAQRPRVEWLPAAEQRRDPPYAPVASARVPRVPDSTQRTRTVGVLRRRRRCRGRDRPAEPGSSAASL